MNLSLVNNESSIVCTGSCLICTDIQVTINDPREPLISNACPVCRDEFARFFRNDFSATNPPPTDQSTAVSRASSILHNAKMPLICGMTDQSNETQQAAVRLAQRSNAAIDWTGGGNWPFAFQTALQDTGLVSCTFGEINDRADLVICWSCDIQNSHSSFVENHVAEIPTMTIDWDGKKQTAALRFLRQKFDPQTGQKIERENETETPDNTKANPDFVILKSKIDNAKYPVFVVDDSLSQTIGDTGVLSLFRFIRQQNDRNHCRLVHLSELQNASGIQATMTAMAGAPFGVTFRDGEPTFRGREFSVESLLSKNLIDAIVLVGSPSQLPQIDLPESAPKIWLCDQPSDQPSENANTSFQADVLIRASRWGIDCEGTGMRHDGVPISRKAVFRSELPSASEILDQIATS